jgi:transcriptional regulator with GAF, ATPase, and Fis domain
MSTHPSTLIRSTDSSAYTGRQTGTPITCAEQFRTRRIARGRSGDTKKPAQFHRLSDARPTSREICEASHLQTDAVSEPSEHNCFAGIVGASPALRRTLDQVLTVAPTDATVLIEGETGTGKELIARAVHNLSPRRDRTFVRFNCAAIPLGLLESELFGHEKGAFTGAIARKMGRFELAHNGTLFLDEIGDIPLELQAKLLRVLQEQEFERLGSNQTQQVSVRIVAATHRNLKQMVAQGLFRSDLYFRLNIFPVVVPPLRERREDIPLLVKAFVRHCVRRMNRCVEAVTDETMKALMQYTWPGNVRELQNFIERAVIMSPDTLLQAPLDSLVLLENTITDAPRTLAQAESTYILDAVKEANWVIGGSKGAAKRLGLKRTTLIGKMRKLGLSRSREAAAIGRSLG